MGMNHYRTKHEPFFYCSLSKEKKFYGDRTGTTVWKIPDDPTRAFKWFLREVTSQESGKTTVWTMKRANVAEYVHPTQKPVELAVVAITKSSKEGDIILDQFLGSGTTLIAAEKAGRSCYGLELDPKFCDVVVQRWVNFTGIEKVIKNGKEINWAKTK
jgi:DNA modification methylase